MIGLEQELGQHDFSEFERVLKRRASWFGKDDIHGHRNSPGSHAVGLWGEIGVLRWLREQDVPIVWSGEKDDLLPDFVACGQIGIETKAQRRRNWTPELATTVQQASLDNWLKKEGNKYVIWTICENPLEVGVHAVWIMGWDALIDVRSSGTKKIRGKLQYQTYPNHKRYMKALISGLADGCTGR
jgi:hypothetical protein